MSRLDEAEKIVGWRQRTLDGIRMTALQYVVLAHLRAHKRDGELFAPVDADPRTIHYVTEMDWVMEECTVTGELGYRITARGERVYERFTQPLRGSEPMCLDCREQPRAVASSGYVYTRCRACYRAYSRLKVALHGRRVRGDRPCSRCGKRPRVQHSNGYIIYCAVCRRKMRKKERRSLQKRKLAQIKAGNPPVCLKCDEPVHHTAKSVSDYCEYHHRQYHANYRLRQKRQALTEAFRRVKEGVGDG